MTTTIKKVRNYALLGTIISVSATAPAQASSLEKDLIRTLYNQASAESKETFPQTQVQNKLENCISSPELDLCNQFKSDDRKNTLNNLLFQKAQNSIKLIHAAESMKVKTSVNGIKHIIYQTEFTP